MVSREKKNETFHLSTYGCQMNLADSSSLAAILAERGYHRVADEKEADLIILNTCSVRHKAEERIYGRLGEIYQFKRRRPHIRIAVVGCMAQRLGKKLVEEVPYVDFVLGTDRLFDLPDVMESTNGAGSVMTGLGREDADAICPQKETSYSGFITISRGCDNYCTYCIVPYVRGREQSHTARYIIDAVKKMVDGGVIEVTLLGQNVNSYHDDCIDFPRLLQRIATETDIKRIRFMTSHPKDFSRQLVETIADEPKLMPHIHLPLQAGSNRILDRMERSYSREHYWEIVDYIRAKLDYVALTTDLMVGFPTETEEDYEMTLGAVREIQFDSAFMFRYSIRPGTAAAKYKDDVPESEKIHRLNRLIKLQQKISRVRNQREIDQVRHCVVEGYSRRSTQLARARTEGNKVVLFRAEEPQVGSVMPIRITAADSFTLHGESVEAH